MTRIYLFGRDQVTLMHTKDYEYYGPAHETFKEPRGDLRPAMSIVTQKSIRKE